MCNPARVAQESEEKMLARLDAQQGTLPRLVTAAYLDAYEKEQKRLENADLPNSPGVDPVTRNPILYD